MKWACAWAGWPVILRSDALRRPDPAGVGASAYRPAEVPRYLRRGLGEAAERLLAGRFLVVFPEGYPNVDPVYTPKPDRAAFLPFRPGFARLAVRVQAQIGSPVPIVPAGLAYDLGSRPRLAVRFGPATGAGWAHDLARVSAAIEAQVRRLSTLST